MRHERKITFVSDPTPVSARDSGGGRFAGVGSVAALLPISPASEISSGSKPGIDATKRLPGAGSKRPWPLIINMGAAVKAKMQNLFGAVR